VHEGEDDNERRNGKKKNRGQNSMARRAGSGHMERKVGYRCKVGLEPRKRPPSYIGFFCFCLFFRIWFENSF
jgi:hypothetical protein